MRDLRHAIRRLVHDWRFTAAAVAILGFGIGVNTAIFSAVNATLLRAQPLVDTTRLVNIYQKAGNPGGLDGNSYPTYLDIAACTDVFESTTTMLVPYGVNYLDEGAPRPATVEHTTPSYVSVLGLRPSLGRWFGAADDTPGAPLVAVVGHETWTKKFGADPAAIGRTIRIEGVAATIVGVGPAGYRGTTDIGLVTDFWLPISALPALGAPPRTLTRRPDEMAFFVKARLREGVTLAQAQAVMNTLGARLAAEYPNEDPGKGIAVVEASEVRVHPQMDGFLKATASLLMAVVGLVLAIACSNLATLLLVRGAARAKDVSVRLALGATRAQLVRHLLTETLLLSIAGCAAGCLFAFWAIRSFGALDLPVIVDLTLDYRVLAFAAGLSVVTGAAFGLAPALASTRVDLVPALRGDRDTRSSGARWLTLKNALVVVQVMVSVVLLGGTTLFLQMVSVTRSARVGFAVDGVAMLETDPRYAGDSKADVATIFEEFRRRVSAIPGVETAVLARGLPFERTGVPVVVDGAPRSVGAVWAGPGFFGALRVPILFGRALDERDRSGSPRTAVVSESMARQVVTTGHAAGAVGRRFTIDREPAANASIEIVGVAADTIAADRSGDLVDPRAVTFYRAFAQWNLPPTTVLARTSLDSAGLASAMPRELRAVNAALPVVSVETMAQYLEASLAAPKTVAAFFGGLGALGICLAGLGLYAVVAFAVSRRAREIGIRMALGARRRQVVWTVARDVTVLVGAGTGLGLGATLLMIQALRAVDISTPGIAIYRPTADPLALLALTVFMAIVGAAAAFVPARRAASLDPLVALRHD